MYQWSYYTNFDLLKVHIRRRKYTSIRVKKYEINGYIWNDIVGTINKFDSRFKKYFKNTMLQSSKIENNQNDSHNNLRLKSVIN